MRNRQTSFMAKYGGPKDISNILHADAMWHGMSQADALDNPKSTREHVDYVLKNKHKFDVHALTAVVRHPTITKDDLKEIVRNHYNRSDNNPPSTVPLHVTRAYQRLRDKHSLMYNPQTKDFDDMNEKLLRDLTS